MSTTPEILSSSAAAITIEIEIDAPLATTWKCLIEDIGAWWRADFLVCTDSRGMTLEQKAGGLLCERGPQEGSGFVWGQIIRYEPQEHLAFTAQIAPPWGGPAHSVVQISVSADEANPENSKVTLTDSLVGHLDEETLASVDAGWRQLFGEGGLKSYAEAR